MKSILDNHRCDLISLSSAAEIPEGGDPASPDKVLKLSKYVHAAGELHDRADWRKWADDVKERVVSKRGGKNAVLTAEDLKLVRFVTGMTCDDYRKAVIGLFNELYGEVQQGGASSNNFVTWVALTAITLVSALIPR